ncbi:MAG: hypothetical protein ACO1NO_03825, partial [Burkholderiaceae bacterium]
MQSVRRKLRAMLAMFTDDTYRSGNNACLKKVSLIAFCLWVKRRGHDPGIPESGKNAGRAARP